MAIAGAQSFRDGAFVDDDLLAGAEIGGNHPHGISPASRAVPPPHFSNSLSSRRPLNGADRGGKLKSRRRQCVMRRMSCAHCTMTSSSQLCEMATAPIAPPLDPATASISMPASRKAQDHAHVRDGLAAAARKRDAKGATGRPAGRPSHRQVAAAANRTRRFGGAASPATLAALETQHVFGVAHDGAGAGTRACRRHRSDRVEAGVIGAVARRPGAHASLGSDRSRAHRERRDGDAPFIGQDRCRPTLATLCAGHTMLRRAPLATAQALVMRTMPAPEFAVHGDRIDDGWSAINASRSGRDKASRVESSSAITVAERGSPKQDRQFTDERTGPETREQSPVGRGQDSQRAALDEVARVALVAGAEQHGARRHRHWPQNTFDCSDCGLGGAVQKRKTSEGRRIHDCSDRTYPSQGLSGNAPGICLARGHP